MLLPRRILCWQVHHLGSRRHSAFALAHQAKVPTSVQVTDPGLNQSTLTMKRTRKVTLFLVCLDRNLRKLTFRANNNHRRFCFSLIALFSIQMCIMPNEGPVTITPMQRSRKAKSASSSLKRPPSTVTTDEAASNNKNLNLKKVSQPPDTYPRVNRVATTTIRELTV